MNLTKIIDMYKGLMLIEGRDKATNFILSQFMDPEGALLLRNEGNTQYRPIFMAGDTGKHGDIGYDPFKVDFFELKIQQLVPGPMYSFFHENVEVDIGGWKPSKGDFHLFEYRGCRGGGTYREVLNESLKLVNSEEQPHEFTSYLHTESSEHAILNQEMVSLTNGILDRIKPSEAAKVGGD